LKIKKPRQLTRLFDFYVLNFLVTADVATTVAIINTGSLRISATAAAHNITAIRAASVITAIKAATGITAVIASRVAYIITVFASGFPTIFSAPNVLPVIPARVSHFVSIFALGFSSISPILCVCRINANKHYAERKCDDSGFK
jgi:hypothetical protein